MGIRYKLASLPEQVLWLFVKLLSTNVADLLGTRVGLFINGI